MTLALSVEYYNCIIAAVTDDDCVGQLVGREGDDAIDDACVVDRVTMMIGTDAMIVVSRLAEIISLLFSTALLHSCCSMARFIFDSAVL